MPDSLAPRMVRTVGLCLTLGGVLGAALAARELLGWLLGGRLPVVAEVWRHSGLTGDFFVAFFASLPAVLGAGVLAHVLIALLGIGLLRRRPWARSGALGLAGLLLSAAVVGFAFARTALEDLARRFPERAAAAHGAQLGVAAVALLVGGIGIGLTLLLMQPSVRAEFRPGS